MRKKSGFLELNGNPLEIVWYGPSPKEAPTLVFLHHGLGCVSLWRDFPAKLADATGFGAMVYSRFGYGRSAPCKLPRPIRYMHHEGLQVLPELLETSGIREYILIGHSDGASIAIVFAGGTPARGLRGLISAAAHVFCEEVNLESIREAKEAYLKGDLRKKLQKYHGTNTDNAFWGWNGAWLNPEFARWNIEEYLPEIKVPVLILQGENDEYGTTAQVDAIRLKTGAESEAVILPDCGHSPFQNQETKTLQLMSDFIKRIETALDLY